MRTIKLHRAGGDLRMAWMENRNGTPDISALEVVGRDTYSIDALNRSGTTLRGGIHNLTLDDLKEIRDALTEVIEDAEVQAEALHR